MGGLYVAAVVDLFSRRVVGWSSDGATVWRKITRSIA
jgi:transposase InsO family protein